MVVAPLEKGSFKVFWKKLRGLIDDLVWGRNESDTSNTIYLLLWLVQRSGSCQFLEYKIKEKKNVEAEKNVYFWTF